MNEAGRDEGVIDAKALTIYAERILDALMMG